MGLIQCKECGKEISDKATSCPHCGCPVDSMGSMSEGIEMSAAPVRPSQLPRKKNRGCLIGVIIFILFCFGIGFGINEIMKHPEKYQKKAETITSSNTAKKSKKSKKVKQEQKENLEIISHDSIAEDYSRYVVGKIKNNTDKTYSYVQVEINLYNGDAQVGSTMDNVNNLEPGQTWEFKAIITDDSCTSYKIVDVTGF